ncbi:MAG: hypothetical protein ACRD3O_06625 [Terriglobia bacterium]
MRCKDVREMLVETRRENLPSGVREHLDHCSDCQSDAVGQLWLAGGMMFLAQESVPEPSIGFSTRVLRRIEDEREESAKFLERAGRRVVYATLVLVFFLLLAMIVPSSGPVRRNSNLRTYSPPQETATVGDYSISLDNIPPIPVLVDFNTSDSGSR